MGGGVYIYIYFSVTEFVREYCSKRGGSVLFLCIYYKTLR